MSTAQEIDVPGVRKTASAIAEEKRLAEIKATLERIETMGLNEIAEHLTPMSEINLDIFLDQVVCGPDGRAIVCRYWATHITGALTEITGKHFECKDFKVSSGTFNLFTTLHKLTLPERHTIEFMTRYFNLYYPGVRFHDPDVFFPEGLKAIAAPFELADEADATQAAEVVQHVFNLDADVVATDNGFAVAIHDPSGDIEQFNGERLAGVCRVLESFSVSWKPKACFDIDGGEDEGYSPRPWQQRIAKRYTQQQRIEAGINAILSHLGHPGAVTPPTTDKTPPEAAVAAQKAKSAAKSSPKQTA